jgi:hypothetical protein
VLRKNGCIVNTGAKISREDLKKRVKENKERYEVSEEEWMNIELPKPESVLSVSDGNVNEPVGTYSIFFKI